MCVRHRKSINVCVYVNVSEREGECVCASVSVRERH